MVEKHKKPNMLYVVRTSIMIITIAVTQSKVRCFLSLFNFGETLISKNNRCEVNSGFILAIDQSAISLLNI
jgi:hypothetical protein